MATKRHLILAIASIVIVAEVAFSETETLGSHLVSFNLSMPASSRPDVPIYEENGDYWTYVLNITISPSSFALISVIELTSPARGSSPINGIAEYALVGAKANGLGGVEYSMDKFRDQEAFEMSYPTQRIGDYGLALTLFPEYHCLMFMQDEVTGMMIQSMGANKTIFEELKSSIKVSVAPPNVDPGSHKPFIGPTYAWAGQGGGAKRGLEKLNYFNMTKPTRKILN